MTEKKPRRVLIATLGQAPGTVTGMLDALAKAEEGPKVRMDEVVTLYTRDTALFPISRFRSPREALTAYESHPLQVKVLCQQLGPPQSGVFEAELYGHYERGWGTAPKFDPRVGYLQDRGQGVEDITCDRQNLLFLRLAYRTIAQHQQDGYEVYVSLAGGRKTMSALLYLATQFSEKVTGCYHLIVPDEIERLSGIEQWSGLTPTDKQRVLHPGEESTLVPIPVIGLPQEWRESEAFKALVQRYFGKDVPLDESTMKDLTQAFEGALDR